MYMYIAVVCVCMQGNFIYCHTSDTYYVIWIHSMRAKDLGHKIGVLVVIVQVQMFEQV